MKLRTHLAAHLRIAVTVVGLMVCLLLIVMFVRSFRALDVAEIYLGYGWGAHVASSDRRIEFCVSTGKTTFPSAKPGLGFRTIPKVPQLRPERFGPKHGFRAFSGPPGVLFLQVPNWFLILIATTLSVAPWLKRRFSLATLLIAVTLVALLMGMVAASQ